MHLVLLPPPQSRPPHPMELKLGMYKLWDGRGSWLPQTIWSVNQGNYDLMLLTETNTPNAVHCRNRLGCSVVCSKATVTVFRGSQGGGWNHVTEEAGGVDF